MFSVLAGEDLVVSAVDLTDPDGKPMDEDNGFAVTAYHMDYPDAASACASSGGTEHILDHTVLRFTGMESLLPGAQQVEGNVVVLSVETRGYYMFVVAEPDAEARESTIRLPNGVWRAL